MIAERDNKIRFFVVNNRAADALDLLRRSLFQTPVPDPATGKVRFLKLPPATVCNKVLHSASKTNDPSLISQAADLSQELRLQGMEVSLATLKMLVEGLTETGQADRALQVVDEWIASHHSTLEDDALAQQMPLDLLTALLEAAALADDPDVIMHALARMARAGLSPKLDTINALIACFMRLGHIDTAHGMLGWMQRSEIGPTTETYGALMTMPYHIKDGRQAAMVLGKVRRSILCVSAG